MFSLLNDVNTSSLPNETVKKDMILTKFGPFSANEQMKILFDCELVSIILVKTKEFMFIDLGSIFYESNIRNEYTIDIGQASIRPYDCEYENLITDINTIKDPKSE